jgi:hypothetical protein
MHALQTGLSKSATEAAEPTETAEPTEAAEPIEDDL